MRRALLCVLAACGFAAAALPAPAAAAPAWLAPVNISEEGRSSLEPQIAVDERGDAVAVWSSWEIEAAYRPAGGSWQAPVQLSEAPVGVSADGAKVAMDPQGDAVAVWSFPVPQSENEWVVQAAVRPAGGEWQRAETISAPGAGVPSLAVDSHGNALAAWTLWNGSHNIVQVASKPAGGAWQAPAELSEEGRNSYGHGIAFGPRGEAIASWTVYDGSNTIVQVSSKLAGGEWEAPVQLSETGRSATTPEVVFDAAGDAVAVWELEFDCPGCSLNGEVIQADYKPAGGTWQAPPVDVSEAGKKAEGAHVAVDAYGDAVAVWERVGEGACCVIQAASKPTGGAWQAPVQLSVGGGNAGEPSLAVDPAGDTIALWTVLDESEEVRVQASVKPAGRGTWQAPVDISEAGRSSLAQQIASDTHGDAIAIWRSSSSSVSHLVIQAAAYDAAGPLLESLEIPATGTPAQRLDFSVSPLDAWSAMGPTRWSFGDGASATGTSATHAYAGPGTYHVTVSGEDALGNTSRASRAVAISEVSESTQPPGGESGKPPEETPPAEAFRIVSMRIKRDGMVVLRLKAPGGGVFGACARMTAGSRSQVTGHHRGTGRARRGRRRNRNCPNVPRDARVLFVGKASTRAFRSGTVTLTIRPHNAALRELRERRRWRVFAEVTYFPVGGIATSRTKIIERR